MSLYVSLENHLRKSSARWRPQRWKEQFRQILLDCASISSAVSIRFLSNALSSITVEIANCAGCSRFFLLL